jgi:hypothetical protein
MLLAPISLHTAAEFFLIIKAIYSSLQITLCQSALTPNLNCDSTAPTPPQVPEASNLKDGSKDNRRRESLSSHNGSPVLSQLVLLTHFTYEEAGSGRVSHFANPNPCFSARSCYVLSVCMQLFLSLELGLAFSFRRTHSSGSEQMLSLGLGGPGTSRPRTPSSKPPHTRAPITSLTSSPAPGTE